MAVGMLPVTGIPLPFISYGGSALSIDLAAAALLCSVARETAQAAVFDADGATSEAVPDRRPTRLP